MSVTYEIDAARGLVRTRCVGAVTFQQVTDHFQALEADPTRPEELDVLLDLREISALPDRDQVRALADAAGRLGDSVRWGRCAIVASRDVVFGVGRMFEMLVERHFRAMRVFRELAEAESWLDHPGAPTA